MQKPNMTILDFLRMQRKLQIEMKEANPGLAGDPMNLEGDALADFLRWNAFALTDEVHEAIAETGWKPWATSRHVSHPEFMREMVDAWHFFLNLLLAGAGASGLSVWEMAVQFENYYIEKNRKNLNRQQEGYDGVSSKCPQCKREMSETKQINWVACLPAGLDGPVHRFCDEKCHQGWHTENPTRKDHMSERSDRELEEIRADIERRSSQGGAQSAEETAQAAMQKHQAVQQAAGYEPITVWEPQIGQIESAPDTNSGDHQCPEDCTPLEGQAWHDLHSFGQPQMPEVKTAETILAKARANGEPVFIFRAKDFFSVMILAHYAEIIEKYGPDDAEFHRDVIDHLKEFKQWQRENVDKVRYPD